MFQQASERAFVSNAYCERKKNHSYPLLRACRFQNFSFKLSEKRDHLCRASTSWPLPQGHCRATLGPWRRQLQSTVQPGQPGRLCPALWLLGVPRASGRPTCECGRCGSSPGRRAHRESAVRAVWQCEEEREEGRGWRVEGVAWDGHRTEVLFFSSSPPGRVPDWLHAGAGAWAERSRGCSACHQVPGPRGTHGSGPETLREPFAGSSVHGKGRGTCTWLVREEKVPHTKSNNQRHVWQPPCRPAPLPSAGSAASTHTHCPGGRREGGAVPSVSRAISLAPLHCRLACDCQEPPDRDPVPGHHSPPLLRQVNNCCCF